jgi:Uma2 family endonuclease
MTWRAPSDVLMTAAEFERLPEDPYYRYELSKGRLVREPRPGARHGRVAFELASVLREFVRAHDLGSVEMETGFQLSEIETKVLIKPRFVPIAMPRSSTHIRRQEVLPTVAYVY